ncbi:hypothetical protein [Staphylococcus aureus]
MPTTFGGEPIYKCFRTANITFRSLEH